jgi:choice-of-anchor B domain-containing protein
MLLLTAIPVFSQNFNLQLRSTMEFPGQTLANICGYTQAGREYALLGGSAGLIIVEVTDPANPVNIVQIPGPDNLWKEIKVYEHYAYVTSEGGQGLQIVDLSALPSPNLNYHYYTGDGAIAGQLDRIHALHIDVKKGFVYLFGGNLFGGAAKVLDLNADPYNPTYAGTFDALGYIHDGFAENDTLYACHIYTGLLSIVDMSDKSNPKLLGTVETPGKFTHNSWLTDDHKHILTTDEAVPSFVTSYDISDPTDIKELDRTSTNDGTNSIGHNTHVRNDWAITSWYTDGVAISDVHRPDNMVITGLYDTWPGSGAGFDGCWGVFPFFPSGTAVASNIPNTNGGVGKLFVFTPTYVRACYLEGKITNGCNGQPMIGASISVNSGNPWINTTTKNDGTFKTGQVEPGNFNVTISKAGYVTQIIDVTLATAQVTELNVTLAPLNVAEVKGVVFEENSSTPIANATVFLTGPDGTYTVQTDANGQFDLDCIPSGDYEVSAGKWGYLSNSVTIDEQTIAAGTITNIFLEKGYYDAFGVDLGWTTQATATAGLWVRGEPVGTTNQGSSVNPDLDSDLDDDDQCYVTGNSGGQAGNDDVDGGSVTLTCPSMQLAVYDDAVLSFWYWFFNGGGNGTPNDHFEVRITNGNQTVTVFTQNVSESDWRFSGDIHLKDYIALTDNVQVQFITADDSPGHLVEAAVDIFKVIPDDASSTSPDLDASAFLQAAPNPSATSFVLNYDWPAAQNPMLEVRNALGQSVFTQQSGSNAGTVICGENWPKGVYVATLRSSDKQSLPVRLVKL